MREGVDVALAQAKEKDYIPQDADLAGSEEHYNMFESMISGRNMHNKSTPPGDQFRKMFPAQIIKDVSMAYKTNRLMQESPNDRFLLIMGGGHMQYGFGVPERLQNNTLEQPDTCMIVHIDADSNRFISLDKDQGQSYESEFTAAFGDGRKAADYCLVTEVCEENQQVPKGEEKKETA